MKIKITAPCTARLSFQPGDTIVKVDDEALGSGELVDASVFQNYLAEHRNSTVSVFVERRRAANAPAGTPQKIDVEPRPFRSLGLWMDIGEFSAIENDSPAAKAGLAVGDRLAKVNGREVRNTSALANPEALDDIAEVVAPYR